MSNVRDCIVVGAGFAGLTAALRLAEAGRDVLCLEARDRVGGRTEAGRLADLVIDLGGMWLAPNQTHLAALAQTYKVRTYAMPLQGRARVRLSGRGAEVDGEAFHEALGEDVRADFSRVFEEISSLSAAIDPSQPWACPDAAALDRLSVAHWMERLQFHPDVQAFLSAVCQSVFCAEPHELSLLFFLFYVKGGGGLEVLTSASDGGAQNLLFHGGVHQIAARMAEALGDKVRVGEPVRAIAWRDDRCTIETSNSVHQAARVIVATPPGPLLDISFDPPLPPRKRALLARQPMGACIKCWIAYPRPFWRDGGRNGLVLNTGALFSPIFDATPPGSRLGFLVGFFDADAAVHGARLSPEQRRGLVLSEIAAQFGPQGRRPIDYAERDWNAEPYSQGCYGAFMAPGVLSKFGPALREPLGPIHWAGTETSTSWSGYIEGAIRSGQRASAEVLARTADANASQKAGA